MSHAVTTYYGEDEEQAASYAWQQRLPRIVGLPLSAAYALVNIDGASRRAVAIRNTTITLKTEEHVTGVSQYTPIIDEWRRRALNRPRRLEHLQSVSNGGIGITGGADIDDTLYLRDE